MPELKQVDLGGIEVDFGKLKEDTFVAQVVKVYGTQGVDPEHPDYGDRVRVHVGINAPWVEEGAEPFFINLNYTSKDPKTGRYRPPSQKSTYGFFLSNLNACDVVSKRGDGTLKIEKGLGVKVDNIEEIQEEFFEFARRKFQWGKKEDQASELFVPVAWLDGVTEQELAESEEHKKDGKESDSKTQEDEIEEAIEEDEVDEDEVDEEEEEEEKPKSKR